MADFNNDLLGEPRDLADLTLSGPAARNQRGGKKNAKGSTAAGGAASRDIGISKALSKILRHDAEKEGLKLDEAGYANIGELVRVFCSS